MALSIILRRSASRVIGGGNPFSSGNLILPGASVPALRRFCSSPSLSSKDDESLVGDAMKPPLDESLVKNLISQVQSLQRDIESLRKSYGQPLSAVEEDDALVDDPSLKSKAIESCNDEDKDSESNESDVDSKDESDEDSNDEGEDNESHDDSKDESDDDSNDEGVDNESDDDSKDEGEEDSRDKSSEIDDESLSETNDNHEYSDRGSDDKSIPKSKENEELLKGLQKEIACAKTFMELSSPDAIIPDKFPFTIKDNGNSSIVLSREYEGEFVKVQVESPTVFTHKNCNDYIIKNSASYSMDLTVEVSCMSAKSKRVELKCGARPEGISIYAAKDPADGSDNEGVHMSEFNENLKQEFAKYLEARGITLSTMNFLYKYMLDKANKERLRILENIEKMVV